MSSSVGLSRSAQESPIFKKLVQFCSVKDSRYSSSKYSDRIESWVSNPQIKDDCFTYSLRRFLKKTDETDERLAKLVAPLLQDVKKVLASPGSYPECFPAFTTSQGAVQVFPRSENQKGTLIARQTVFVDGVPQTLKLVPEKPLYEPLFDEYEFVESEIRDDAELVSYKDVVEFFETSEEDASKFFTYMRENPDFFKQIKGLVQTSINDDLPPIGLLKLCHELVSKMGWESKMHLHILSSGDVYSIDGKETENRKVIKELISKIKPWVDAYASTAPSLQRHGRLDSAFAEFNCSSSSAAALTGQERDFFSQRTETPINRFSPDLEVSRSNTSSPASSQTDSDSDLRVSQEEIDALNDEWGET